MHSVEKLKTELSRLLQSVEKASCMWRRNVNACFCQVAATNENLWIIITVWTSEFLSLYTTGELFYNYASVPSGCDFFFFFSILVIWNVKSFLHVGFMPIFSPFNYQVYFNCMNDKVVYVLWSVYIAQRKGLKLFHRHGDWMIWLHVLILKDDCNKFEIWNDWFMVYVYLYFTTGRHVFGLKSEIYHEEKRIQEISCWVQEKIHTIL